MKSTKRMLSLLMAVVTVMTLCSNGITASAGLFGSFSFSKHNIVLAVGNEYTVPSSTGGIGIESYSSSDKNIATVDSDGKITAKSIGTCTITGKKGFESDTCTVYVQSRLKYKKILKNTDGRIINPGSSISASFDMNVDGIFKFVIHVDEKYIYDYGVNVSVRNSSGTSVSSQTLNLDKFVALDYTVYAPLNKGNYTVVISRVTTSKSSYADDKKVKITYDGYAASVDLVEITSASFDSKTYTVTKGKSITISPKIAPSNANAELTWTSSDTSIATVTNSGVVKGLQLGKVKITAKRNDISISCTVVVNKTSATVARRSTVKGTDYIDKAGSGGTWSTSSSSVATVSKSGVITGKSAGKCSIYYTKNGTKYTIALTVLPLVSVEVTSIKNVRIYNDLNYHLTNNSNKDITYVTMTITQYDNRGYRLKSPYDYYYINSTIKAGNGHSGTFWVNDDCTRAKITVTKIWFADGTTATP